MPLAESRPSGNYQLGTIASPQPGSPLDCPHVRMVSVELRQLKYFVKIAELGNMTRAAELLHVAQPALSQQMRNLETELGVQLFHRSASGLRATEAGSVFRVQAQLILRHVGEAVSLVHSERDMPTGEATLGLSSSTARMVAIPLLDMLRSTFPRLRVRFIEAPSDKLLKLLAAGDVDLVIAVNQSPTATVNVVPLIVEQFYVIRRPDAVSDGSAGSVSLESLAGLPLVLPGTPNSIREFLDTAFRRAALTSNVVSEISSTAVLVQAVLAGMGATVLPWSAVCEEVRAGRLVATPLAGPDTVRTLSLCTMPRAASTAATRIVHSLIVDVVAQLIDNGTWKGVRTARSEPAEVHPVTSSADKGP
jgi:LysR family transcriptional regulator, nitrogen assimilation regulatory protein